MITKNGSEMFRLGRRTTVAIFTCVFLVLETGNAVAATASIANDKPWYAAWYLWIGLAVFVIVLVSVMGTSRERK